MKWAYMRLFILKTCENKVFIFLVIYFKEIKWCHIIMIFIYSNLKTINIFVAYFEINYLVSSMYNNMNSILHTFKTSPPMEHFLLFFLLFCGMFVLVSPVCKNPRHLGNDKWWIMNRLSYCFFYDLSDFNWVIFYLHFLKFQQFK